MKEKKGADLTKKGAELTTFGQEKKGADLTEKGADLTNSPPSLFLESRRTWTILMYLEMGENIHQKLL